MLYVCELRLAIGLELKPQTPLITIVNVLIKQMNNYVCIQQLA